MTLEETLGRIRRDSGILLNEETTKLQIIVPILSDLGWDVYNRERTDEAGYQISLESADPPLSELVLEMGTGYEGTVHYRRIPR